MAKNHFYFFVTPTLVLALGCVTFFGGCKSRHTLGGRGVAGLRDAGTGPSEADKALAEFEVIDCSTELCGDGESDSGAGGLAFANPAAQDMLVASGRAGVTGEQNPYGDLDYGRAADDTAYALALKSAPNSKASKTAKSGNTNDEENMAVLGEVADAWNTFGTSGAAVDRTQILASSVESVVAGILGPEVAANPASLDPARFVSALQRLEALFDDAEAGRIGEPEVVGALELMAREGFGHPGFDRAAAVAVNPNSAKRKLGKSGPAGQAGKTAKAGDPTRPGSGGGSGGGSGAPGSGSASGSGRLGSLLGGLRFSELAAMQSYYSKNLVASSADEKTKLMSRLRALMPAVRKIQEVLTRYQITDETRALLMETAKVVAGQDGFINRGDLPRILPVVPTLVGEIADQKIEEGLADGIAKLRAEHPFVYRRWARAPGGMIGRAVNRGINKKLNEAYGLKLAAISAASGQVQNLFNGAMDRIGTTRYFVGTDSPKNYYDPAAPLELPQIDRVVRALTGRSVRSVAEQAANSGGNMEVPVARELAAAAEKLFAEVELPDGIFVADGLFALQQKIANPDALILPAGIQVVLAANGKIRIGARRDPCSCEYSPKVKQCVFLFTPITGPGEKNTEKFYQGLGAGVVVRNDAGQAGGEPQCNVQAQCAQEFTDPGYKYFMPHSCGGYFWAKPGNLLFTAP